MAKFKKYSLITLIILGLSGFASAQQDPSADFSQNPNKYPKHELGVSYGLFPVLGLVRFNEHRIFSEFEDLCPYKERRPVWSGSVNLQYHCHFNKHNALDLHLSWAMYMHRQTVAVENKYYYLNQDLHFVTIQLGYSVHYYTSDKLSLYSSIYLGGTVYCIGDLGKGKPNYPAYDIDTDVATLKPAVHVNFIGARIGKRNAANIEVGFGTQGVLKLGYSCHF